ncbi:gamma-glutamyltransferase [Quadrisphaera sp. DSM 44207]|uniref:gamma-glutamyltransferase n=1 Tax=Quadrisphaera sp. DSM 44207 TaxID=1881057 RepID=UPI0008817520|nr:gamma-glutamyltransferase [Quadrisphaera sp. DSM 44207]SDQ10294.1 gamma-glutamyltranspeptidase / glutathione hydrolase [Quadrisphaera sp. DSM 44207]
MTRRSRPLVALCATSLAGALAVGSAGPAAAGGTAPGAPSPGSGASSGGAAGSGAGSGAGLPEPPKVPVMTGGGGAVSSIDPYATQVGIDVLEAGGNAADAAVATAAALGVTEPYSAGIGGGGFFVHYDAGTGEVTTIDGRESAPATFTEDVFTGEGGEALDFDAVVSSGLSVGVPGTPALWERAVREHGTRPLGELLRPAERLARQGFVVDETFADQTRDNEERFRLFPETVETYLPGGQVPEVGSTFRNPDLARAYRALRTQGTDALYDGRLGRAVVDAAREPLTAEGVSVLPGQITREDLRAYEALEKDPVRSQYRGLDVYGMTVPASGGIAVAEILNLLEAYDARTGTALGEVEEVDYLHRFAEASATAFADRNRWVGDVADVPVEELVSQGFADERACALFDPALAQPRPLPFGEPDGNYAACEAAGTTAAPVEDQGTTHLTVADREGNVVSFTLTIEQTGGSGITVPGYGFLLNNELTDFSFTPTTEGVPDPNLPGPGKRPRSSMAPTIVLDDGEPVLALGSPGGPRIITTVAQVITRHVDRGLPLGEAIAAPRLSSRNGSTSQAEPAIVDGPLGAALTARGHALASTAQIGAATGIRLLPDGGFEAATETTRRGGGAAAVVDPDEAVEPAG